MRPLKRFDLLKAYQPGKPIEEVKRELGLSQVIKLASNENPLGASPLALAAVRRALKSVNRYPEGSAYELRRKLAKAWGLDENRFVFGNGSNEILIFTAQAYVAEGKRIVFSDRSFAVYEIATHLCGGRVKKVASPDFTHDLGGLAKASKGAKLVYVCNPNNPTGSYHNPKAIEAFLKKVPKDTLIVLDEAYAEFAGHELSQDKLWLKKFPNLLICRTFSKIYGLAGFRVGYGVASTQVVQALEKCRQPFNLNGMAQKAATAALGDGAFVRRSLKSNAAGYVQITAYFDETVIWYMPSATNFIFFRELKSGTYEALLKKGIIIRQIAPSYLRVTIGTAGENARFIRTMREINA